MKYLYIELINTEKISYNHENIDVIYFKLNIKENGNTIFKQCIYTTELFNGIGKNIYENNFYRFINYDHILQIDGENNDIKIQFELNKLIFTNIIHTGEIMIDTEQIFYLNDTEIKQFKHEFKQMNF